MNKDWKKRFDEFITEHQVEYQATEMGGIRTWYEPFNLEPEEEADLFEFIQSVREEAIREERERIHKQIAKIANYDMVDDKSKLSFKWLLMEMESQDAKLASFQPKEEGK